MSCCANLPPSDHSSPRRAQPPPLFGHRTKGHYQELQKATRPTTVCGHASCGRLLPRLRGLVGREEVGISGDLRIIVLNILNNRLKHGDPNLRIMGT